MMLQMCVIWDEYNIQLFKYCRIIKYKAQCKISKNLGEGLSKAMLGRLSKLKKKIGLFKICCT